MSAFLARLAVDLRAASALEGVTVAIPGTLTSAWLALQMYHPGLAYVVMPFDEILEAVRDGKAEAGLLIHEGQLTYADEGLRLLVDHRGIGP